jgi:hypothetical protein
VGSRAFLIKPARHCSACSLVVYLASHVALWLLIIACRVVWEQILLIAFLRMSASFGVCMSDELSALVHVIESVMWCMLVFPRHEESVHRCSLCTTSSKWWWLTRCPRFHKLTYLMLVLAFSNAGYIRALLQAQLMHCPLELLCLLDKRGGS